ncbi:PH domain-containing protein [Antrihabitans cavernicola]|uniref:PH domain-containing protein n=1 Tax=Antrihabitans cavernicola TaxID=2495913 RepID=UPI0035302A19
MDNSEPLLAWSTPIVALVVAAGGGLALGIAALAAPIEGPGRLLVGLAALGLLVIAGLGFRQRPRILVSSTTPPGLVVNRLRGPVEYRRDQITRVRIVTYPRLGRRVPMLEIDVAAGDDERLLIFGRWDLGTHPQDVFDALAVQGLVPGEN